MPTSSQKRPLRPDFAAPGVISGLVTDVRVAGASLARFTLRETGGIAMQSMPYLFVVLAGSCQARLPDGQQFNLERGDAILALQGACVQLSARAQFAQCANIADVWRANSGPPVSIEGYECPVEIDWGDGAPGCVLLGSAMVLSHLAASLPIIAELPSVVLAQGMNSRLALWTDGLNRLFDVEAEQPYEGFAAISAMTTQFILAQILRTHLVNHAPALANILDKGQPRALAGLMRSLQRHPERPWSLTGMAREAGMSRTRFVEYFGHVTGTTPFRYLTACRIERASQLLQETDLPIAEIALQCGYRSERAFREAFGQAHQMRPLAFRKAKRAHSA